jgi:hypothetical protein
MLLLLLFTQSLSLYSLLSSSHKYTSWHTTNHTYHRKRLRKKKAHEEKQKRKEQKRILREREKKRLKQHGEKIKKFTRERVTKNTSRNNRKSTQSVSLTAHMIEAFRELFDENDNKSHDEEGSMWCGCVASSSGYCSLIEHQLQGRAEREAEMHVTIARTKILTQLAKGRGPFVSDLESRLKRIEKDWNERNGKKVVDEKKEDRNKKNNNIDDNDDDGEEFLPDVARKEIVRVLTEEAVLKARLSAHERVIMARNHHLTRYDPVCTCTWQLTFYSLSLSLSLSPSLFTLHTHT